MNNYILDENRTAVAEEDLIKWADWWGKADNRRVARTEIREGVYVSTVFLGIDHQFGDGPPLLFETMIFGGLHDEYQQRYSTWEEAVQGHAEAVVLARLITE